MPKVALGPLFIVTFGAGFGSILMMGVAITVVITTLVIHNSFRSVSTDYLKLARSFGATRRQLYTRIIFPACIPDMIAALKVNVGLASGRSDCGISGFQKWIGIPDHVRVSGV